MPFMPASSFHSGVFLLIIVELSTIVNDISETVGRQGCLLGRPLLGRPPCPRDRTTQGLGRIRPGSETGQSFSLYSCRTVLCPICSKTVRRVPSRIVAGSGLCRNGNKGIAHVHGIVVQSGTRKRVPAGGSLDRRAGARPC